MEVDPAPACRRAAQRDRVRLVRLKSRQNARARVIAHNRPQLLQREEQPVVALTAAGGNAFSNRVVHSERLGRSMILRLMRKRESVRLVDAPAQGDAPAQDVTKTH